MAKETGQLISFYRTSTLAYTITALITVVIWTILSGSNFANISQECVHEYSKWYAANYSPHCSTGYVEILKDIFLISTYLFVTISITSLILLITIYITTKLKSYGLENKSRAVKIITYIGIIYSIITSIVISSGMYMGFDHNSSGESCTYNNSKEEWYHFVVEGMPCNISKSMLFEASIFPAMLWLPVIMLLSIFVYIKSSNRAAK